MIKKIIYTQNEIINEIVKRTGLFSNDVKGVLVSLADVVKDKLSDCSDVVEIRPFTGLCVTSKKILPEQNRTKLANLKNVDIDNCSKITVQFTKRFKTTVSKLRKIKKEQNY